MQAHLEGTANRLVEQGHDLVKVSTHRGACELCQPWQGKVLSITGKTKGYRTLEEAKAAGLFHPNCYSKDTEVYTDKGWRLFSELSGDEKILSLNPETHCLEWVSYRGVISYRYSGNMMRFKSNSLDLLVTPDHNMYVGMNTHIGDKKVIHYRLIPAEQLKDRNFKIPRTARWEGGSSVRKFMGVPIEQFAKLLGYYLSEGHAEYDPKNRRYRVSICQHDKRNMEIMRNDLKSLGFYECHNRLILSGKEFASYFLQLGKAHEKHIPDWFMEQPPEILRLFLDAYRLGDGSTRTVERQERNLRSVERKYFTSSKRLADQIGECILKVGNYPYFYLQKVSGKRCSFRNGDYIINHDVWVIAENTSPHSVHNASPSCRHRGIQITDEPYNDMVYCVELEKNHVLWVRRNGRTAWCGNCRHAYGLYIDLDKEIEELEREIEINAEFIGDIEEIEKWEEKYYGDWVKSLSKEEKEAFEYYTMSGGAQQINDYLRAPANNKPNIDEPLKKAIPLMENAIKRAVVPHDIMVHRSVSYNWLGEELKNELFTLRENFNVDKLVGKEFIEKGFTSTSLIKGTFGQAISMNIQVPKGMYAAAIEDVSVVSNEHELLFPPGLKTKVVSAKLIKETGRIEINAVAIKAL